MKHENPWKTLDRRVVYENRWVRVREDKVIRPDGAEGIYGVIEIRPSVGIVALNDRDEVALVGQWRYTTGAYSWEIPRGGSDEGESDPAVSAARELREETGLEARNWRRLSGFEVGNGVTTDVQHIFLATGLSHTGADPDPEERIAVRWQPFEEAVQEVVRGEITECCTVAALLLVDRLRRGREKGFSR